MKKTTIPLIIFLIVALVGGLMLVKQNQDARKGASFGKTKLMLLPSNKIEKGVGETVAVKVHFLTESEAKVDGVHTVVCYGTHLKLNEGAVVVNTQNGFESDPIVVIKDNCATLVATSKQAADKLKTTGEVFALNFEALSEGEGTITINKEKSMVTGDNPNHATDKEIAITSVENTTYKITGTAAPHPSYCSATTVDKSQLIAGQSVKIGSVSNTDVNNFSYIVYNMSNTTVVEGKIIPKVVCVAGSGYQGECPSGSHVLSFSDPITALRKTGSVTVSYAQLFDIVDLNNGSQKPTKVQINAYFSKTDGPMSVPQEACVKWVEKGTTTQTWPVLNYKMTYGGVIVHPETLCAVNWPVQIVVLSAGETKIYTDIPLSIASTGTLIEYQGSLTLEGFTRSSNVAAFLKGPKHLQMKYAIQNQSGRYNKAGGELVLTTSADTSVLYNFTGYPMLAGDLVGATINDGPDGEINGVDFAYLKSLPKYELGAAGTNVTGDLDGNCMLTTNDVAVLRVSLAEKQGELY